MATLRKLSIAPVMVTPLVAGLVWFFMFNETYGTITWLAYELELWPCSILLRGLPGALLRGHRRCLAMDAPRPC